LDQSDELSQRKNTDRGRRARPEVKVGAVGEPVDRSTPELESGFRRPADAGLDDSSRGVDADAGLTLAGTHLRIHRVQIERIVAGLSSAGQ
jgi:hypothetical protein